MDLHLRDAFPHLSGCPLFWQHELYVGIIHPTVFVIEPFFSPGIAPDLTFHLECLLVTQRYLVLPQVLYHYRRRQDSVEHVQGIVRAEKYAQGMPALMNALDVWMQAEPQLADSEVFRRQALQRLYLFLLVNLQRITKECSPLEVSRLLQAAMDETPSRPLQEAMTYAAIRIPVTEDALEYE